MRGSDQGQRRKKRQCLTCKNKGCIGHCRFAKAKGACRLKQRRCRAFTVVPPPPAITPIACF